MDNYLSIVKSEQSCDDLSKNEKILPPHVRKVQLIDRGSYLEIPHGNENENETNKEDQEDKHEKIEKKN